MRKSDDRVVASGVLRTAAWLYVLRHVGVGTAVLGAVSLAAFMVMTAFLLALAR